MRRCRPSIFLASCRGSSRTRPPCSSFAVSEPSDRSVVRGVFAAVVMPPFTGRLVFPPVFGGFRPARG
ncbi:unnamed protein product [Victoria cruziana]